MSSVLFQPEENDDMMHVLLCHKSIQISLVDLYVQACFGDGSELMFCPLRMQPGAGPRVFDWSRSLAALWFSVRENEVLTNQSYQFWGHTSALHGAGNPDHIASHYDSHYDASCTTANCYCYPLQISCICIKLGSLNWGWSTTTWQCLLRRTHTWILDDLRPDCQTSSHVEVLCRQSRSWHVSEGSERFISCILLEGFLSLPWMHSCIALGHFGKHLEDWETSHLIYFYMCLAQAWPGCGRKWKPQVNANLRIWILK